jgi:hypothetical protein
MKSAIWLVPVLTQVPEKASPSTKQCGGVRVRNRLFAVESGIQCPPPLHPLDQQSVCSVIPVPLDDIMLDVHALERQFVCHALIHPPLSSPTPPLHPLVHQYLLPVLPLGAVETTLEVPSGMMNLITPRMQR